MRIEPNPIAVNAFPCGLRHPASTFTPLKVIFKVLNPNPNKLHKNSVFTKK